MRIVKRSLLVLIVVALWVGVSLYGGLFGWWMSPIAAKNDSASFFQQVSQRLQEKANGNVAFVLIENHEVYGQSFAGSKDAVDENTLFPLASMSKLFAAYGAASLAESKHLPMDLKIQDYLTRWAIPESAFDASQVTLERLLSHTAGFTDGLGFADIPANEPLPSLEESLLNPRASTGEKPITIGIEPGTSWQYSGGSYLITELWIEETSSQRFADWMQQAVFDPLGMSRSTYAFIGNEDNVARSFDATGQVAPHYQYASAAATGLSSSAADLTKFALLLLDPSVHEKSNVVKSLTKPLGITQGAEIWGAGAMLYAPAGDERFVFGHDGANEPAINSALRVNPVTGDGIVVLVTGNPGLASEIGFEWTLWQTGYPDFLSLDKAIDSAMVPTLVGIVVIIIGFIALFTRRKKSN